jgi:hypothetical protein
MSSFDRDLALFKSLLQAQNVILQMGASCHQGSVEDALEMSKAYPVRILIVDVESILLCVILSEAQETQVVISSQQLRAKPPKGWT